MNTNIKQILRRGAMIFMVTALCITGSYVFSHRRTETAQETAANAPVPVIVLDAGHGASS